MRCRYNAVIFFSKSLQWTPYSLPMRARYGLFFVIVNSDLCSASVDVVLYVVSCYTGPRNKWIFVVETLCDWIRSPLQIRMTDLRHLDAIRSPSVTELRHGCPNSVTVDFLISNVLYNKSFSWNAYFCVCFSREVCIVSYRNIISTQNLIENLLYAVI